MNANEADRPINSQSLHDMLRAECIAPCRVDTVSSIATIIRLVEDGGGVATLPRVLVDRANNPRLRILHCPTQLEPLPLWLSWRPQRNNRAVADALAMLLAFLGELLPGEAANYRAMRRHRTQ